MKKKLYSPDQLSKLLADRNLLEVSNRSGIPYNTVRNAYTGKDVRASTLARLTDYIDGTQGAA